MAEPLIQLRHGLQKHFGPGAAVFVDPFLWMSGYVAVDIVRLDYWLQQRNHDYQDNDSMRGFIRRKYGRKAEHFVAYWLKGESASIGIDHQTKGEHSESFHKHTNTD